jgi:hypothetical protein
LNFALEPLIFPNPSSHAYNPTTWRETDTRKYVWKPILPEKEETERATEMARGNQRDKAREKNLKEQAGKVTSISPNPHSHFHPAYAHVL